GRGHVLWRAFQGFDLTAPGAGVVPDGDGGHVTAGMALSFSGHNFQYELTFEHFDSTGTRRLRQAVPGYRYVDEWYRALDSLLAVGDGTFRVVLNLAPPNRDYY